MKSKEVIKKEIEEMKETLKRAEKCGFQELAEQCKEDITKYNQILKDLDELEELKNLMGTPIQDIMKRLKRLDVLKRNVGIRLAIQEWANKETKVFPNDRKIVKEWLEDDK